MSDNYECPPGGLIQFIRDRLKLLDNREMIGAFGQAFSAMFTGLSGGVAFLGFLELLKSPAGIFP